MAASSGLVLVTGASGFIASHIVKLLQSQGHKVRGTVRSLANEDKVKPLYSLCSDAKHKLELVEANLNSLESWDAAVKDCEYVIHVASPFPSTSPQDENEIIRPAVEGTTNVFKACAKAKSVKRIVLTSSCAAIAWEQCPGYNERVRTEKDWSDTTKIDAYSKSKTLAERAAWDFIKELPAEEKIELAVINPAFVMGPVLHGSTGTSQEVVKRLLEKAMPAIPKINFPVVDVRDVAIAHVKAMTLPEAAGNRHILATDNMYFSDMAHVLKKEFEPQGYNIPTMVAPYFVLWLSSIFDKTVKMILPQIGLVYKFDNSRMKNVLGIVPHTTTDTLVDMAYTMIERGFVFKTKKYRGPPEQKQG
ncbi:hypothetical protein LOTGIDRAFT_136119 [Lottia gigantea]|uniref:NAD-dependent epimerase/dehydratase domain-containing protein n=1 Tax=Lottia gigantea TaxID=225164 RepID=V4B2Y5_LOTGI|nr:hypothetical protein LOTGIDRAFT_136119 [Lottia gigantea]ESP04513.1 hypothetical protein LOTGIDRAFT_136119 [Lottia gigantea]